MLRKVIAWFLGVCLLIGALPVFAMTETEKDAAFSATLLELEHYLEAPGEPGRSLDGVIAAFSELGKYRRSDSYMRYAMALQMIEAGEFGRTLEAILRVIDIPDFEEAVADTDSELLCSPKELKTYRDGREAETNGAYEDAMRAYEACLGFYDSTDRFMRLEEALCAAAYDKGMAMFEEGNLAGAYFALIDCPGYELTDTVLAMIVEELGYVLESPADNRCRHEWQAADCTTAKTCVLCGETEGEALGHSWIEATCTVPAMCTVCGKTEGEPLRHKWADASCTTPKTCTICGKTEGEPLGHDFMEATYEAPETCSRCGETRGEPLLRIAAGDIMTFGHYEQDNNLANGPEPIEWHVLDVQDGKALLLSRYGLDVISNPSQSSAIWRNTKAREWLNGSFFQTAFSSDQQNCICQTMVISDECPHMQTDGNIMSDDRVFLLSVQELLRYMPTKNDRICRPTRYANNRGATVWNGTGCCDWWLRSVAYDGSNAPAMAELQCNGDISVRVLSETYPAMRPAMWINLDAQNDITVSAGTVLSTGSPKDVYYDDGNTLHRYEVFFENVTWSQARDLCKKKGGHLATITSEAEWYAVRSIIIEKAWLGGTLDKKGNWTWITGEPWSFSEWCEGQPDNWDNRETYVGVYFPEITWNDYANNPSPRPDSYICEWDDM